ncbi:MAG TPA: glycoside hydrolase family 32 protein [Firmicutes bacterium]|nr:glycoside hydrolase family 32 protein [Bacillota bacterium]
MEQRIVQGDYLWLPVHPDAPKRHVEIVCGREKAFEMEIPCALPEAGAPVEGTGGFYACLRAADYHGRALRFEGAPAGWAACLKDADAPPAPPACPRPLLHFTPPAGWINDPNGLVYFQGNYHLCYQYNPYDVVWGNMTWGHAHSPDLLHWQWDDPVLHPDGTGTIYSGSAVRDDAGAAGYGPGRVLYYYTAAGGTNRWSAGRPFEQYLAVGSPDGMRLEKTGRVMVPAAAEGARDPKVFYHAPTKTYGMALYLSGEEFALYRSADLLHWREASRLCLPGAWECPDLFELAADDGSRHWVFWTADGYYFVGGFDGTRFYPQAPRRCAYAGGSVNPPGQAPQPGVTLLPYAAQTFSGLEDGRTVSLSWLRTPNPPGGGEGRLPYTGMMALPVELSLTADLRLRMRPVRELARLRGPRLALDGGGAEAEGAYELAAALRSGRLTAELPCGRLEADGKTGVCRFVSALADRSFSFAPDQPLSLRLIADTGIVEIYAQDGTAVMACETAPVLAGRVACRIDGEGQAVLIPLFPRSRQAAF